MENDAVAKIEEVAQRVLIHLAHQFPNDIQKYLKNVEFGVKYEATEGQKKVVDGRDISGIFIGKPFRKPATILLFARMILADCNTDEKIELEVRRILLHEIGHYLGMNHARLEKMKLNTEMDKYY